MIREAMATLIGKHNIERAAKCVDGWLVPA